MGHYLLLLSIKRYFFFEEADNIFTGIDDYIKVLPETQIILEDIENVLILCIFLIFVH